MSKLLRFVILGFLPFASGILPAQAEQGYAPTIGEKLGTGITNVATGWMEIPHTMYVSSQKDGLATGLTLGFFKGVANTVGRSAMGVVDMTTFMIPTKPMMQPGLVWQNFGKETTYNRTWELYETH